MNDSKLDKIADDIQEIKITLAEQAVILDTHIKRSDSLEAQIEPLKATHAEIKGLVRLVKWLGYLGTAVTAIIEIARFLWH